MYCVHCVYFVHCVFCVSVYCVQCMHCDMECSSCSDDSMRGVVSVSAASQQNDLFDALQSTHMQSHHCSALQAMRTQSRYTTAGHVCNNSETVGFKIMFCTSLCSDAHDVVEENSLPQTSQSIALQN